MQSTAHRYLPGRLGIPAPLAAACGLTVLNVQALKHVELCCPALTDRSGVPSLAVAAPEDPPKALPPVASLLRTRFQNNNVTAGR